MNAVKTLLEKYELANPLHLDSVSNFTNPLFEALFDTLMTQGKTTMETALKVGALIEKIGIWDLQAAIDSTVDNQDIAFADTN